MTNFKFFSGAKDNHYAVHVIHQDIQDQLLISIRNNFFN